MRLKPWQWVMIITETMLLLGVSGALAWMLLFNPIRVTQPQGVAQAAAPSPTLTPTDTPTPTAWPTPLPTQTPQPTHTRVVAREKLNQEAVDQIERQVVQLRGIQPHASVPIDLITRAQMMDTVRTSYAADQAAADREMALYRALGLARPGNQTDQDSNLKAIASSIAGFYNAQDRRLAVVSDLENLGAGERGTLAHEYTHALQDQQFDLTQVQRRITTTDARLALSSVVEGDATTVMSIYLYGSTTQSEWDYLAYRAAFSDAWAAITATNISTRANELLGFPYLQGAQFIVKLWLDGKGWAQVNHAYADPPPSTSIVLHPERYLTQPTLPVSIPLPDFGSTLGKEWTPTIKLDTLGEFVLSVHLDEFLNDRQRAAQAANGWAGDSFSLWQAAGDRQAFAWKIAWDTPRDTGEFVDAYTALLRRRVGPSLTVEREEANLHWVSGSAGSGLVQKSPTGEQTLIVWGPDRTTVARLLAVNQ